MPSRLGLLGVSGPIGGGVAPPSSFVPTDIYGMELWVYQPNIDYSAGTWVDRSGNVRNLTQATAGKRPTLSAALSELNGQYGVVADGSDDTINVGFTLSQPHTTIGVVKQVAWTLSRYMWDGDGAAQAGALFQETTTPRLTIASGGNGPTTTNLPIGRWGLVTAKYNGTSSLLHVDGSSSTGNPLTTAPSGFTFGSRADDASFANVAGSEFILYRGAVGAYDLMRLWNEWVAADRYNIPITFNPASVGTLAAWYKADALALADGANVASWPDSSGNSRTMSQIGAAFPIYKLGFRNGKPCVRFAPSMNGKLQTGAFTLNQPTTVYTVMQHRAGGGGWIYDGRGIGSSSLLESGANVYQYSSSGTLVAYPYSQWSIVSSVHNGTTGTLRVDGGAPVIQTSGVATNPSGFTLGDRGDVSVNANGAADMDVAEILVYSGAHSDSLRQQLEGYLSNKYAINAAIRPFDPLAVPNCARWYNAQTTDQTVDGGAVTTMYDRAGSGLHVTQATGANKPLFRLTGGPNGLPSLEFDGSNDELLQSPAGAFFTSTPHTYMCVVKNTDLTVTQRAAIGVGAYNANGTQFGLGSGAAGYVGAYLGGAGSLNGVNFQYSTTDYSVIVFRHVATPTNHIWADGLVEVKAAAGMVGPSAASAIGSGVGGGYWKGHICEAVVINAAASDADIASLIAWACKKYDIGYKAPNHSSLLANLQLWYDLQQQGVVADGTAISSLTDFSGNGRHATQGTGSKQPTFQTLEQNGRPAARGDNTDDNLTNAYTLTTSAQTIFVVGRTNHTSGYHAFFTTGGIRIWSNANSANWGIEIAGIGTVSSGQTVNAHKILSIVMNGYNNISLYTNGANKVTSASGTGSLGDAAIELFSITSGAAYRLDGDILAVVLFNAVLSDANRRAVENYLAQQFNIAV